MIPTVVIHKVFLVPSRFQLLFYHPGSGRQFKKKKNLSRIHAQCGAQFRA